MIEKDVWLIVAFDTYERDIRRLRESTSRDGDDQQHKSKA